MPFLSTKTGVFLLALCLASILPAHAHERQLGWWDYVQHKADEDGYKLLTTQELLDLFANQPELRIIDCRYDYEYDESRVAGSKNVPLNISDTTNLSPDSRQRLIQALGRDKDMEAVFYCRDFR
ncbi:MAG: rhodanese-like domain-containing protein [Desulfonatronovibrionaceae bacterium]